MDSPWQKALARLSQKSLIFVFYTSCSNDSAMDLHFFFQMEERNFADPTFSAAPGPEVISTSEIEARVLWNFKVFQISAFQ